MFILITITSLISSNFLPTITLITTVINTLSTISTIINSTLPTITTQLISPNPIP